MMIPKKKTHRDILDRLRATTSSEVGAAGLPSEGIPYILGGLPRFFAFFNIVYRSCVFGELSNSSYRYNRTAC